MAFYLLCCTDVILNELSIGLSQKEIALTYALAMKSEQAGDDKPDWKTINKAIADRWTTDGLTYVKVLARRNLKRQQETEL